MTKSMVVYVGLALITTFLAQLEHLNSDELPGWTWVGWSRFVGYIVLAGLTTFKAYVARPPYLNGDEKKDMPVPQNEKQTENPK